MRALRHLLSLVLLFALLAACNGPGGGGGGGGGGVKPPPGAPEYVEAGLVVYDSILPQSKLVSPALRRDLQRALEPQELPLGYRALLKVFWKAVPDAEGYRVHLREDGGSPQEIASLDAGTTELTLADVLPQVDVIEGRSYEVGVAAVANGQDGTVTWSWPLGALGAVALAAPQHSSAQPSRPTFIWSNARGNPAAAELDILDTDGAVVLGGCGRARRCPPPLPPAKTCPMAATAGRSSTLAAAKPPRTRARSSTSPWATW